MGDGAIISRARSGAEMAGTPSMMQLSAVGRRRRIVAVE